MTQKLIGHLNDSRYNNKQNISAGKKISFNESQNAKKCNELN